MIANQDKYPLRAVRAKCLDCCNQHTPTIKYCTMDGIHSTACPLWPFRFGMGPATATKRFGVEFLTPKLMPDANSAIEEIGQQAKEAPNARVG